MTTNLQKYLGKEGFVKYVNSRRAITIKLIVERRTPNIILSCPSILKGLELYKAEDPIVMHQYRSMIYQYFQRWAKSYEIEKVGHGCYTTLSTKTKEMPQDLLLYEQLFAAFKEKVWEQIQLVKTDQVTSTSMIFDALPLPHKNDLPFKKKYYSYIASALKNLTNAGAFTFYNPEQAKRRPKFQRTGITIISPAPEKFTPFNIDQ